MPKLEEHIIKSLKRSGKKFTSLHEFLDGEELSLLEKLKRHNIFALEKNLKKVKENFGSEGVSEFIYHLKEDYKIFPLVILWKIFERRRKGNYGEKN